MLNISLLNLAVAINFHTSLAFAEWTRIAESKEGTVIYIDHTTLQRTDNHTTLLILLDEKSPKIIEGVTSKSAVVKLQYDCNGEKLRILAITSHAGNMGLGKITNKDTKPKQWEAISPVSMGGASFDDACSIFSEDGAKHRYSHDEIPNWLQGPSTDVADVFFDPKSTKHTKNKVSMSVIINKKFPLDFNSRLVWSAIVKAEFNCIEQSSRYSQVAYFTLPYGKGERITDGKTSSTPWKAVSDDGLSMGMWAVACRG